MKSLFNISLIHFFLNICGDKQAWIVFLYISTTYKIHKT